MHSTKICHGCFEQFRPDKDTHRYCSPECRKLVEWEWREARLLDTGGDEDALKDHFKHRPKLMRRRGYQRGVSAESKAEMDSYAQAMRELREERKRNGRNEKIDLDTLIRRDRSICYLCGGTVSKRRKKGSGQPWQADPKYPTMDHVIPLSRDGEHAWDNIKLAHWECNMKKGGKMPT